LFTQLVSKIFSLCGHDPPTLQTDRQTDDMRSKDRALHCGASRGRAVKTNLHTWPQLRVMHVRTNWTII